MKKITVVTAAFALLTACGGDSEPVSTEAANTAPTTSAVATTATGTAEPIVPTAPGAMPTELTEDLRYHPAGEPFTDRSGAVDVIAPTEGGPWPTVVVFHGDPLVATKTWHRSDAQFIAEQGRIVFLAAWGHLDSAAVQDMGAQAAWELNVREAECAVAFARSHTAEFGGDPDHITLYGFSAGASPVLMAGLSEVEPLDTCLSPGPAGAVQALVAIDADWVMGGSWDTSLRANPEAFYSITPWRLLDGSQGIPIHVMVAEIPGSYTRPVGLDPATSWLSYRHIDIHLVADLDKRGFLADGEFSLKESSEYAVEILQEAGYDATLVIMTGASHDSWGDEGKAIVVDTVVHAETE